MTQQELNEKVLAVLKEHDRLTPQEIAYKVGDVAIIQVHKSLSKLTQDALVETEEHENNKYFKLPALQKQATKTSKRDTTKYKFRNLSGLNKGRLALAVVRAYVEERKPTMEKLEEVFPANIAKPYGVFKPFKQAKEMNAGKKRYFDGDDDVITLTQDGNKKVLITNQWTTERTNALIEACSKVNLKVQVE